MILTNINPDKGLKIESPGILSMKSKQSKIGGKIRQLKRRASKSLESVISIAKKD